MISSFEQTLEREGRDSTLADSTIATPRSRTREGPVHPVLSLLVALLLSSRRISRQPATQTTNGRAAAAAALLDPYGRLAEQRALKPARLPGRG